MFEKAAEEYATKHENTKYNTFEWWSKRNTFQKGAEFGYDKANEWHKQDIDDIYDLISKDWNVRYFICIMKDKSRVTAFGNCDEDYNGDVSVNLFFDHDDEKYGIDDIVWWQEIELPKENK